MRSGDSPFGDSLLRNDWWKSVLPYLYEALKDPAVSVRRTAGDCLSDIGDVESIPVMVEALKDASKLVRWRAAMFLYENGDETVLPALKAAETIRNLK